MIYYIQGLCVVYLLHFFSALMSTCYVMVLCSGLYTFTTSEGMVGETFNETQIPRDSKINKRAHKQTKTLIYTKALENTENNPALEVGGIRRSNCFHFSLVCMLCCHLPKMTVYTCLVLCKVVENQDQYPLSAQKSMILRFMSFFPT